MWPDTENVEKALVFLVVLRIRRFWEPCVSWKRLGCVLERLGSVLEGLGAVLEPSWGRLGGVLERLGGVLKRLGAS